MSIQYLWDYDLDLDETQFPSLLEGELTIGRLDSDLAAIRLLAVLAVQFLHSTNSPFVQARFPR